MKIKQTILSLALIVISAAFVPMTAFADSNSCGVKTAIITCSGVNTSKNAIVNQTAIWSLLLTAINILTAGIGIAAVGGVVYGSIMYASAGGSADQVKKARGIITNVVIGITAYAIMYSLLNFLIPGGLFN